MIDYFFYNEKTNAKRKYKLTNLQFYIAFLIKLLFYITSFFVIGAEYIILLECIKKLILKW